MDKIITIPDEILEELKAIAAKHRQPLKNFIESELIRRVEAERKREKKLINNKK